MGAPETLAKGVKLEKELVPGYKLKTENKKPIVGVVAHPTDRHVLFILLVDGSLMVCGVGNGTLTTLCALSVNFDPTRERGHLHSFPNPWQPGAALVLVEAERSGLTVLSVPSRNEIKVLSELPVGAGAVLAGSGFLHKSCLLVAALRHAGGNVGIRTWRLRGDSRSSLSILPVDTSPSTVWDVLQSDAAATDASSLADVSGEALISGMVPHGPSGLLAFWTSRQDDSGAAHFRVPLLGVVDGTDPLEGLGTAKTLPLHTAPSFWTSNAGHDGVVSKLHFPRYAHVLSPGQVLSYDLTHGLLSAFLVPPTVNAATGQERTLVHTVRSSKLGLWLPFSQIISLPKGAGHPWGPGHCEFTAVPDAEAAMAGGGGLTWLPGRDAVFVGRRDELVAVLSNSGSLIAVFDALKLATALSSSSSSNNQQQPPRALYVSEVKEGTAVALFPGPPTRIPPPPEPRPSSNEDGGDDDGTSGNNGGEEGEETDDEMEAALREWEEGEARRREPPRKILMLTATHHLVLSDVSATGLGGSTTMSTATSTTTTTKNRGQSVHLLPSEAVIQIAWQPLVDPTEEYNTDSPGADTAIPCAAAILTSARVLVVDDRLQVLVAVPLAGDVGIPTSALWVGPALLVTTSTNQVLHVRWDGKSDHAASLLSGLPSVLVAALADRLVLATRGEAAGGLLSGKTEVATRGFAVLSVMLIGWATLAARGLLPGGGGRARHAMRILLASYDASQVAVEVLNTVAACGFADVAAAAAVRSELSEVNAAQKAAFAAAAGDWDPVLELIASELESSEWYPTPPPRGSVLYSRVVTLARACEVYGKFTQARTLFAAAGAWNELFALCVFQGDFSALHSYARGAGKEVAALADQLAAVNENTFMRLSSASAFGGRPNAEDWTVLVGDQVKSNTYKGQIGRKSLDGEQVGDGGDGDDDEDDMMAMMMFDVAPAGRLPFMEASLRVTAAAAASGVLPLEPVGKGGKGVEEEEHPIAPLDLTILDSYLGVAGASVVKTATGGAGAAAAAAAALPSLLERSETSASSDLGLATATAVMASVTPRAGGESASIADSDADAAAVVAASAAKGETPAQSAARAAFKRDSTVAAEDEDDFFSSDEDESNNADGRSAASFAASTSNRFLINIRSPDDTPRSMAGGDSTSLRKAALSLKLGGSVAGDAATTTTATPRLTTGRSSISDDVSSVSSMETFGALPKLHTIPTPPPAAPFASQQQQQQQQQQSDSNFFEVDFGAGEAGEVTSKQDGSTTAAAAAAAQPITSKDPFAALPGLPPTLAQKQQQQEQKSGSGSKDDLQQSGSGSGLAVAQKGPLNEFAFSSGDGSGGSSGAPMRPQQPPPVAQSDLLSGWDEFEALFGGGGTGATPVASTTTTIFTPTPAAAQEPIPVQPQQQPQLVFVPPPTNVKKVYNSGIKAFRVGQWAQAAQAFQNSLTQGASASAYKDKDAATAASFRQQCVYLYAAASLIARSAAAPPAAASKLSRYAASLPLGEEQRAVATAFAVEANMAAGNYGWAGDQLAWLVVVASEGEVGGPGLEARVLAERLEACDRAGGRNAGMGGVGQDDVESFAAIVGSCETKSDVDDLIRNLLDDLSAS